MSKRLVLGVIANMYRPLGIIDPSLIDPKTLLRKLCKLKIDWDEDPNHVNVLRSKWIESLKIAKSIRVEGSIVKELAEEVTKIAAIHGFSDASQIAHCTATYLPVYTESCCQVGILLQRPGFHS